MGLSNNKKEKRKSPKKEEKQNKNINNYDLNNPENIEIVKNLIVDNDLYGSYIFIVFKSINNIMYLIYTNINNDLITYNIIDNQKINQLKNAHKKEITNIKYYADKNNKRELIMSISEIDNNIKIWGLKDWQCIYNYKEINFIGYLISACFLKDNNEIYIITSNYIVNAQNQLKYMI